MILHTAKLSVTADNEMLPSVSTLEYMIHGGIKSTSYDPYHIVYNMNVISYGQYGMVFNIFSYI